MRIGHKLGLLALALSTVPAAAQETGAAPLPDTTGLAVVFVVFPSEDGAQTTMNRLNKVQPTTGGAVKSYAVVSRDKQGKLKVQETPQQDETRSQTATMAENTVDGMVALLGQPRSQTHPDSAAGQAGTTGVSSADMDKMQEMLAPGTSAIIAVVPEPQTGQVTSEVDEADATDSGDVLVVEMVTEE